MDPCNNVKKPKYMHLQWDLVLKKKKKTFQKIFGSQMYSCNKSLK